MRNNRKKSKIKKKYVFTREWMTHYFMSTYNKSIGFCKCLLISIVIFQKILITFTVNLHGINRVGLGYKNIKKKHTNLCGSQSFLIIVYYLFCL